MKLSIESGAGAVDLPLFDTHGFVYQPDPKGLGLTQRLVEWAESPAGGGRVKSSRVGMRDAELPVVILGDSSDEVRAMQGQLGRVLSTSPVLVVALDDGGKYRLPFEWVGGGNDSLPFEGATELELSITIRCPDPYWVSDDPVQIGPIGLTGEPVGLLPDLAELQVMGSSAFGDVQVENPGDAEAPVTWMITGPGGPATVELGGRGFVLDTVLEAGESVTVRKGDLGWTVTDQTGASRYADLGPAPKFPSIPVGESTGSVLMTNAGAGSSVAGFFRVLRRVVV